MSEDFKWYVVHTYSGYENKVASNLMSTIANRDLYHLFNDVRVPVEKVKEIADGKEKVYERKLYPGYVFIKMVYTDESWHIVKNIRGCTGFVGTDPKSPLPLTEAETIRMGVEAEIVEVPYRVEDKVRVTRGPYKGKVMRVEEIDLQGGVVHLTFSGQAVTGNVTVEMGLGDVEPV